MLQKPHLTFWQIINMNVGFFGIQYSFGLQQSAVNPIYDFLGASPDENPLLNLAGPVKGLVIQPIIGALSDKTWHSKFDRRKPYFFIIAITGFGIGWASMMGILYLLLVNKISKEQYGLYMGVINMMIVILMMLQSVSLGTIHSTISITSH